MNKEFLPMKTVDWNNTVSDLIEDHEEKYGQISMAKELIDNIVHRIVVNQKELAMNFRIDYILEESKSKLKEDIADKESLILDIIKD